MVWLFYYRYYINKGSAHNVSTACISRLFPAKSYTAILISAKPRTIISIEIFAMGGGKIGHSVIYHHNVLHIG